MATTSRGYPLFQQADNADIASKLNAISTAVNTDVAGFVSGDKLGDSGVHTNSSLSITLGSGWGSLNYTWQLRNGWVFVFVEVARTGGTITAASNGNISNLTLATINTYNPPAQMPGAAYINGAGGVCVLNPSGVLQLVSFVPAGTISNGDLVRSAFVFPN